MDLTSVPTTTLRAKLSEIDRRIKELTTEFNAAYHDNGKWWPVAIGKQLDLFYSVAFKLNAELLTRTGNDTIESYSKYYADTYTSRQRTHRGSL